MSASPVKDWLRTKGVAVWPTTSYDLTDHRELEDATLWFERQLAEYLEYNGFVLTIKDQPELAKPWPAPTWRDHESELEKPLRNSGPHIPGLPASGLDEQWERTRAWVERQKKVAEA